MKISGIVVAVLLAVLLIGALSIWFYPSPQDFMDGNTTWNGVRDALSEFEAAGIGNLGELPDPMDGDVLATVSYLDYNAAELAAIKEFVSNGGTLLLLDDFGYGNTVLAYLGTEIRFSNLKMFDPRYYHKNPALPRITNFAPQVKESGIEFVVLNHATTLTGATDPETIAQSSGDSFLDWNGNEGQDLAEPNGPFTVAAKFTLGKGQVAVVSDPSIMINSMLDKDDNLDFIRYLAGYDGGRSRLFFDNSRLADSPLDAAKSRLAGVREALANPYVLAVIAAVTVIAVSRFTFRKGELIGRFKKGA